jgi:uncharacterized protein (DUF4415 family)
VAKKSSASSRPVRLVQKSAESIFSKPITASQKKVLARIAEKQKLGDDSDIDFSDIPELTDAQLKRFKRPAKRFVTLALDADVCNWLHNMGPGPEYSKRVNNVLRVVMSQGE